MDAVSWQVCVVRAGCNITLYYHAGFCYLMMRRYLDASRAFNTILTFINQCGLLLPQLFALALSRHSRPICMLPAMLHVCRWILLCHT